MYGSEQMTDPTMILQSINEQLLEEQRESQTPNRNAGGVVGKRGNKSASNMNKPSSTQLASSVSEAADIASVQIFKKIQVEK